MPKKKPKHLFEPYQFRLESTGRLVVVNDEGELHLAYDRLGAPDMNPLSPAERREVRRMLSDEYRTRQDEQAREYQLDPQFEELRNYIVNTRDEMELAAINQDPILFNRAIQEAKEAVGPSEAEVEAVDERAARIKAVKRELAEAVKKDKRFDPDCLAELIDLEAAAGSSEEGSDDDDG